MEHDSRREVQRVFGEISLGGGLLRACLTLSWRNLSQRPTRTTVAATGICFAIFLLFLQIGFLDATRRAATLLYEFFHFDLAVVSSDYQYLAAAPRFDRVRLTQARTVPEVRNSFNIAIKAGRWTDPANGLRSTLLLVGIDDDPSFVRDPRIRAGLSALKENRAVLVDAFSHEDYGDISTGAAGLINNREVRVVGHFELGAFFYAEGAAITHNDTFGHLVRRSARRVSIGLLRLAPGGDSAATKRRLAEVLPGDVRVLTREELIEREQDYFTSDRPVGLMFQTGMFIGFVVGVVILFQVISTEIGNRMGEFATLKAMGFGRHFVLGVGVTQTALFALLGFLPAWLLGRLAFHQVSEASHLPMRMDPELVVWVGGMALAMCLASALLTLHRLRRADPAELF